PNAGTNGTLTVCAGTTPTSTQLFAALGGSPSSGGMWSGPVSGVYTYTVKATSPCSADATSTITITEKTIAPPTLYVVQPTCLNPNANITVTSSTSGLLFSFDGGAYVAYPSGGYTTSITGSHTVSSQNTTGCVSAIATVTVNPAPPCGGPIFTFTQGFYHGTGKGCTPNNGSLSALQIMQLSLQNMGGTLYLGKPGAFFTVTTTQASLLQSILPGGGKPSKLAGNYNLNAPNNYPPLQNGRINNVLLSQTITLALNVSIPGNGLSTFVLKDGYLTTMTPAGSACSGQIATCENGGQMSSVKLTGNAKLMALLNGKTVADLLKMASDALGGTLPSGVSYSDISNAVDVINRSFDEGRYYLGYYATQQFCLSNIVRTLPITLVEESVPAQLTVTVNPNPVVDNVNFEIQSIVGGQASLDLYNVMGVKLANVFKGKMPAGKHVINYNIPSSIRGTLIYTYIVGGNKVTGQIIRVK
ncbi:MAG: hypothetical protein ABIR31_11295, partial [Ginsengibacter sp.]